MSGDKKASIETKPNSAMTGPSSDDHISRAKVSWQKAVDLSAKDDTGCKGAIDQAKKDLQGS